MSSKTFKSLFFFYYATINLSNISCFYTEELESMRDNSRLVKLDLTNLTDFVNQDTMVVVFYYRILNEVKWLKWLDPALSVISPISMGMVYCDSEENFYAERNCYDLGLRAPSVVLYKYGFVLREYHSERNTRDFVKFVRKETPNNLVRLDNLDTFENTLDDGNITIIVGFFQRETDLEEVFIQVAKTFRGPTFGYSSGEEVLRKMNVSNDIVLFRPKFLHNEYESDCVKYTGEINTEHLIKFIEKHQHGLVGIRGYFSVDEFPKPQIIAYFNIDQNEEFKKFRSLMLPVADEHPNITFAISRKSEFFEELKHFGIDPIRIIRAKILIIAETKRYYKYILNEFKTQEHLSDFAYGVQNGLLSQFIKSQELHHSKPFSDTSHVYEAVGSNFLKLVNNNYKDLLVTLYRFECYENIIIAEFVASEYEKELHAVGFISLNVELNDVSYPFYYDRCPTIFFVGKNRKSKPVLYGGSRDYTKVYKFMEEQRVLHKNVGNEI